jgi:hypothetical protein
VKPLHGPLEQREQAGFDLDRTVGRAGVDFEQFARFAIDGQLGFDFVDSIERRERRLGVALAGQEEQLEVGGHRLAAKANKIRRLGGGDVEQACGGRFTQGRACRRVLDGGDGRFAGDELAACVGEPRFHAGIVRRRRRGAQQGRYRSGDDYIGDQGTTISAIRGRRYRRSGDDNVGDQGTTMSSTESSIVAQSWSSFRSSAPVPKGSSTSSAKTSTPIIR